jgi:hypothetical protein
MKPNTLFQVRFRPSVKPPRGWTHSAHYNVLNYDRHHDKYLIGKTWLPAKDFIKIEVQDAPVFNKRVLRTIKSLKENECIEIPNDSIRDLILEQAEREGLSWAGGMPITVPVMKTPCHLFCRPSYGSKLTWPDPKTNEVILPASKFVEVPQEKEPETDWSKVPFPEGYVVPKGVICVNLVDALWDDFIIPSGSKLQSLENSHTPYLELLEGEHRENSFRDFLNGHNDACLKSFKLAPLNPTDHPNHPEFGKKQEEPITEPQKDDCKAADERIKELERICELRLQDNDGLADECDKWKTMLTATNQHIDKLRDICQIASSTGSKEIMQSVLKSIATGEI